MNSKNDLFIFGAVFAATMLLTLVGFSINTSAQNRTMTWSTEFCDYRAVYNSRKYTEAKLRNTLRLLNSSDFRLDVSATVWKFEDINYLDVKGLEEKYTRVKTELAQLEIVEAEPWISIRKAKLKELDQVYKVSRATMLAYRTPSVLNELDWAPSCKKKFVPALIAGGEDLLKVWTDVNMDSRSKNGYPSRLKQIFDEQYASPKKLEYALVETMAFGWWNCANGFIEYDGQEAGDSVKREEAFKKLFVSVKEVECAEP